MINHVNEKSHHSGDILGAYRLRPPLIYFFGEPDSCDILLVYHQSDVIFLIHQTPWSRTLYIGAVGLDHPTELIRVYLHPLDKTPFLVNISHVKAFVPNFFRALWDHHLRVLEPNRGAIKIILDCY